MPDNIGEMFYTGEAVFLVNAKPHRRDGHGEANPLMAEQSKPRQQAGAKPSDDVELMEATRQIMGRLAETPHKPHAPISKGAERPALKGGNAIGHGKQQSKPKKPRATRS